MGRRSHTQVLYLWMNGAFVGTWSVRPHAGEILQYDDNWVASEQGRPLSLSLPFTPGNQPHRGDTVRAYFENLLPDSQYIRERVAHRFQAGSTEAFALLAEVGRDCVGALQVLPDKVPPQGVQEVEATPLNDAEVAQVEKRALGHAGHCASALAGCRGRAWCRGSGWPRDRGGSRRYSGTDPGSRTHGSCTVTRELSQTRS